MADAAVRCPQDATLKLVAHLFEQLLEYRDSAFGFSRGFGVAPLLNHDFPKFNRSLRHFGTLFRILIRQLASGVGVESPNSGDQKLALLGHVIVFPRLLSSPFEFQKDLLRFVR